ncbi:MAG: DUF3426 domain-containing protein [Candidatus Acinetobacter avistercoris]|uniref:zinc-ribbon and DUF3426 domain-containing protein n=1 Tax=Acinetobacter sp. KS-LM10 TaxID=3120518 RepID=UPI001F9FFB05|nr:DUF3426 domain-containing protein [Candidatus Acinetobacter avistercoris]
MSEKQTRCPNCSTIYRVSVTQLTVAQGMVCCPKCFAEFNALLYLYQPQALEEKKYPTEPLFFDEPILKIKAEEQHIFEIFDRKIENSNINLRTYLNNINTYNNDPITHYPSLNLSFSQYTKENNSKGMLYYVVWSIINLILAFILFVQILWFNPDILSRSPALNTVFIHTCNLLSCETIDQRYHYIKVDNLQLHELSKNRLIVSGALTNTYKKGLELPLIKLTLMKNNKAVYSMIKKSDQYLIQSLSGITRIPQNSPYKFEIELNIARNSFDSYKIEVIRP